jgi:hypothetical protein
MVPITALWLPILLSAVIVFVASSILHMVLPFHRSDYRKLPEEEKVADALRAAGVIPGPVYSFPHCTHKDMKSPEVVESLSAVRSACSPFFPADRRRWGNFWGCGSSTA